MPIYLDTRGKSSLGIAICARCGIKHSRDDLREDPNYPGLMVCDEDRDQLDPYRLPARETENITMEWTRPDLALSPGPQEVIVKPLQAVLGVNGIEVSTGAGGVIAIADAVTELNPSRPWTANTQYQLGDQVTPGNPVGFAAAGTEIPIFVCFIPGLSGAVEPIWPTEIGVEVEDGQVYWINQGLYLP
jgi:hypothetical protein